MNVKGWKCKSLKVLHRFLTICCFPSLKKSLSQLSIIIFTAINGILHSTRQKGGEVKTLCNNYWYEALLVFKQKYEENFLILLHTRNLKVLLIVNMTNCVMTYCNVIFYVNMEYSPPVGRSGTDSLSQSTSGSSFSWLPPRASNFFLRPGLSTSGFKSSSITISLTILKLDGYWRLRWGSDSWDESTQQNLEFFSWTGAALRRGERSF